MATQITKRSLDKPPLITAGLSKTVLQAIRHDLPTHAIELPDGISLKAIENLRGLYKEKVTTIPSLPSQPRNQVFYKIIQAKIPGFSWKVKGKHVVFDIPKKPHPEPPLLSLLLYPYNYNNTDRSYKQYTCLANFDRSFIIKFSELLKKLDVIYPNEVNMGMIANWLTAGLQGKKLTIFSLICPDYSVVTTGDPVRPFRHTFKTLGTGIGLIARRTLNALPLIKNFFDDFNINFRFVVALADYEILSESNLKRLHLSFEQFLERIELSRQALKEKDVCNITISNPMITELCGGYDNWKKIYKTYREKFQQRNFGCIKLTQKDLITMVKTRQSLYTAWYGEREDLSAYIPLFLDQGAEYATVSYIIKKHYQNCLVLGADHSIFGLFYQIEDSTPTLYLKRFYS